MDNNTGLISKTLEFYSEEDLFKDWYLDLPEFIQAGGTKADLQMVAGTEMLLDILSDYGQKIKVKFSNEPINSCNILTRVDDLGEDFVCTSGAYYYIDDIEGIRNEIIWLNIAKFIFNDVSPKHVYYKVVSNDKNNNS